MNLYKGQLMLEKLVNRDQNSKLFCKSSLGSLLLFSFRFTSDNNRKNYLKQMGAFEKAHQRFPKVNLDMNSTTERLLPREKERDLTQSYDKSPYTYRQIKKAT